MNAPVRIRIALIYPGEFGRLTDEGRVEALVSSIKEIGLRTPITVRSATRVADGRDIDAYEIVTGRHRYAAACKLGWEEMDCVVTEDDALHSELWQIDENLIRAELSPSDRAAAVARRKEIYEELHPETRHGVNQHTKRSCQLGNSSDEPADSFIDDTAKATGQSKRKVARDAERGSKIAEDVLAALAESQWDKGTVLDILTKLSHDEQRQALRRVQSGASPSFKAASAFIRGDDDDGPRPARNSVPSAADPLSENEVCTKQVAALMAAWNKASAEAREIFLDRIDQPVFDRGRAA